MFSFSLTCFRPSLPPAGLLLSDCPHRCPELDACINGSLWCDGVTHCPSGFDEAARHCFYLLQLPTLYLVLGAVGFIIVICTFFFVSCRICRKKSKSSTRLKSLPSDTEAIVGTPKEVICWPHDNSVRYVEVDRVTTVWPRGL